MLDLVRLFFLTTCVNLAFAFDSLIGSGGVASFRSTAAGPLAGLVHLGVTGLVCILGRARCADDGGVHDGGGVDLEASGLQFLTCQTHGRAAIAPALG